ncbi:hypothetical protein RJ640_026358 [Escallonia rubra]|uniref:Reverse transcriptase Ty1/copia-type domain-containing protein n=1 Tax=Escallonia rubra TaxID=112253 RepID=A0AA88RCH4_9ASTE|nr:hypothetical protein RJ640_026358 [Escallonia rubra]
MPQNAVGFSSGPLQASAGATQNSSPFLGQTQVAATIALPGLTPEQMQRLITFLESSPSGTGSLVGKSLPTTHTWLIDSGASHHMTGNLNFFSSIWVIPPSPVGLPDDLQTNAIKAGSVSLADGITLRHVLYVPRLAVNLISVSCLATNTNCFVAFSHDICVLQDRTSKSPIRPALSNFFPDSTSRAMDIFGLIHCDIWGPYRFEETVFPFTTPFGPSPTPETTIFCPVKDCAEHPMASPLVIGGDTPPVTGGDPPPSPAATPSPSPPGITTAPDPKISSPASPPSSPTAPSPTFDRGKRQKKAPSILKDYVCHTAQVLPLPTSSTPTNGSSGPRYPLDNFVSCKSFSVAHTQFLDAISSGSGPHSYKVTSHDPKWRATMRPEIDALEANGDVFLSILVYVDDLILAGNNSTACSSFRQYLNDCFKLKDLGPLKYFLGIEAACGPRGLFFSQRKYALDILFESSLSASKPAAFPTEQNHDLALPDDPLFSDPGPYR